MESLRFSERTCGTTGLGLVARDAHFFNAFLLDRLFRERRLLLLSTMARKRRSREEDFQEYLWRECQSPSFKRRRTLTGLVSHAATYLSDRLFGDGSPSTSMGDGSPFDVEITADVFNGWLVGASVDPPGTLASGAGLAPATASLPSTVGRTSSARPSLPSLPAAIPVLQLPDYGTGHHRPSAPVIRTPLPAQMVVGTGNSRLIYGPFFGDMTPHSARPVSSLPTVFEIPALFKQHEAVAPDGSTI